jgi:hypothetical protein
MRVRILRSIVAEMWAYHAGMVVSLDDATAAAWCASGIAERFDPVETATSGPQETAARRGRRR